MVGKRKGTRTSVVAPVFFQRLLLVGGPLCASHDDQRSEKAPIHHAAGARGVIALFGRKQSLTGSST